MYNQIYSKITDTLVSDGYIIIQNALEQTLPQKLLNLTKHESHFKKAGISSASDLHIDKDKRSNKILWLNEEGEYESDFLAFAEGLKEYLNRSLFLGLSYYESHLSVYNVGDFYEKHFDSFQHSKNRVVTTVYYLNDAWSEDDGGELLIYDINEKIIEKVLPNSNTLVVFMSEKFPHEVLSTNKKRYCIAGWFRVDKI